MPACAPADKDFPSCVGGGDTVALGVSIEEVDTFPEVLVALASTLLGLAGPAVEVAKVVAGPEYAHQLACFLTMRSVPRADLSK